MIRINITAIIQNEWVLDGGVEHPKELRKLRNDYPLAPHKIEIKWEIFSDYQLRIQIFTIFLLVMLQKLVPNFLVKKSMCFIMKTCNSTWG